MNVLIHVKESVSNIFHAKMQSFLAILGVLVGTASVVALISYSSLGTEQALAQFKTLGVNLLAASIQGNDTNTGQASQQHINLQQMPLLKQSTAQISEIAPYISLYKNLSYRGQSVSGSVIGTVDSFATIGKIKLNRGRFISFLDNHSFYCVVGSDIAKMVEAQGYNPIGQQINVGSSLFTIVGVMDAWKPNMFIYFDLNNSIIIPLNTAYIISKNASINDLLFRLIKNPDIKKAQAAIADRISRWLPQDTVRFRNPMQVINAISKARQTYAWLLGSIGGISLIVGGIGVMNIMLVSVIERRREIGVRMAIGAQRSDILKMFLIESVFLTLIGGAIGVVTGVLISYLLALLAGWQFHIYWLPPALGFFVSVLVGIVSGIYPAIRASRLDPVQTLYGD